MTLLIACFLVHGFHMEPGWYAVSFTVWVAHLACHEQDRDEEWTWLRGRLR